VTGRQRWWQGTGAAAIALVASMVMSAGTPVSARSATAPASGDAGSESWPTAGADLRNSRAMTDSPIDASTVDAVTERWRTPLPDLGSLTTVPMVVGGTVYLAGGSGRVAAIDASTGVARWISDATGFNIGPFGVAVDDTRVYTIDGSSGVAALDRPTGARVWRPTSGPRRPPGSASSRSSSTDSSS
jgi:outer membrane protein assembly factor BamB